MHNDRHMTTSDGTTIGPHARLVDRLCAQAEELDDRTVARLFHAWSGMNASSTDPYMERRALRVARGEARRAGRLDAFEEARSEAASRFRQAHRGEAGAGGRLGLSMAIANAAGALVVADLLDPKTFEWLYAPWRIAVEEAEMLTPMGPGEVRFGQITQRRRMVTHR